MTLHKEVAAKVAIAIGLLLAATVAPTAAQTANPYPTHPVMLIVPYAAGGVADVGMRILGDKLSDRLKQQFVIENIVPAPPVSSRPGRRLGGARRLHALDDRQQQRHRGVAVQQAAVQHSH